MLKFCAILLFILCAGQVHAQDTPKTILWKVSKPGIAHTSYLFGTFHEVNGQYFSSLTASARHLANADRLFIEQTSGDAQKSVAFKQQAASWNTAKWNQLLSEKQKRTFADFVKKADDSIYYKSPPLTLRLALFRLYAQNFCDTLDRISDDVMDQYIEKLAVANQTPVVSLDTDTGLVRAYSAASNSTTTDVGNAGVCVDMMDKMLRNDASVCGFIQEYKNFDLDYEFGKDLGNENTLGVQERNTNWAATLNEAFRGGNCFVAVGFRHLMYKQGLIQQLRSLGYQVTPVSTR